jgi:DNA-binding beta-propeller fold protein YncE
MRKTLFITSTLVMASVLLLQVSHAQVIDASIGNTVWFVGNGTNPGHVDAHGHSAFFNNPEDCLTTENGTLWVLDTFNFVLRRVQPHTDFVETWNVHPASTVAWITPSGMAMNGNESWMFVVDNLLSRVTRIVMGTRFRSLFAGSTVGFPGFTDGVGTSARFNLPWGIDCWKSHDLLFVTEFPRIRKIFINNASVKHFSGGANVLQLGDNDGTATSSRYVQPRAIVVLQSSGVVFFTDTGLNKVRRVATDGSSTTFAGVSNLLGGHDDGAGASATFDGPFGLAVDKFEQFLFVADANNNAVRRISLATAQVTTVIGTGNLAWSSNQVSFNADVAIPLATCYDVGQQRLYVAGQNSVSYAETYTPSISDTMTQSKSESQSESKSHSISDTVTQTKSKSLSASISVVDCDVQFCTCMGLPAYVDAASGTGAPPTKRTALECAHAAGNCTTTRHCTERHEWCLENSLVPFALCPLVT